MVNRITKNLTCPKCGLATTARVVRKRYKFLVYRCPQCSCNVVSFSGKVVTVSDKLMATLFKSGRLTFCGDTAVCPSRDEKPTRIREGITRDMITDLKILLETESDVDSIISKL